MQVLVDIPDPVYHVLEHFNEDVKSSIVKAVEIYTERKRAADRDPFHKWLQTPVLDKEGKTDVSVNHDHYLYGFEKK